MVDSPAFGFPSWIEHNAKVWFFPEGYGTCYSGVVEGNPYQPGPNGSRERWGVNIRGLDARYRKEVIDTELMRCVPCSPRHLIPRDADQFQSKYLPRDASAFREGTAAPVFLFQSKRWKLIQVPVGFEVDDEGDVIPERCDLGPEEDPVPLSWNDLHAIHEGPHDMPCAIFEWYTERVFLTREEGHRYGEAKRYNYRDGWRVYSVPAEGELVEALRDGSEQRAKEVSRG